MPRQKRPLAESDANATKPASKRVSTGSNASGEENVDAGTDGHDAMNMNRYHGLQKAELSAILESRGLPKSGANKAILLDHLKADDLKHSDRELPVSVDTLEFNKAGSDDDKSDVDDEDEDESDGPEDPCGGPDCMCDKAPAEHPEWKWSISKRAKEIIDHLMEEFWKRDQDAHGEYHYNDFTGYGFQELMENELLVIEQELKKNNARAIWPHIEALAIFLPLDCMPWFMSDDSDAILDTMKMVGGAVMIALQLLEKEGLLHEKSDIPNIGLVIGLLKDFEGEWPGGRGEKPWSWVNAALLKVKKAGIELKDAPFGIEKHVEGLEGDTGHWNYGSVKWDTFDWQKQMKRFRADHRKGRDIGGTHYSLVKKPRGGNGSRAPKPRAGAGLATVIATKEDIEEYLRARDARLNL